MCILVTSLPACSMQDVTNYINRGAIAAKEAELKEQKRLEEEKEKERLDEEAKAKEAYNNKFLDMIRINLRGYDEKSSYSAVMVSDEEIIVTDIRKINDEEGLIEYNTQSELYSQILTDRLSENEELLLVLSPGEKVGLLSDMLLCLEYYPDSNNLEKIQELCKKFAESILGDVANEKMLESLSMSDKFSVSAVLAYSSSYIDDDMFSKDALDKALEIYADVSKEYQELKNENNVKGNISEDNYIACSAFWAAAQVYATTGQVVYRKNAEKIVSEGVTFDCDSNCIGYYGCSAYLHSSYKTDNGVSEILMDEVFDAANELILTNPIEASFKEYESEYGLGIEGKIEDVSKCIQFEKSQNEYNLNAARLCMIANYVSTSVEYSKYADVCLNYLYGCNIYGCDYTKEIVMEEEKVDPVRAADIFILCALSQ